MVTRRHFISSMLACACCVPNAQTASSVATDDTSFQILCGMRHTPTVDSIENMRAARPEAIRVIKWVANLIGVRPVFEVLAADFKRRNIAVAATRGDHRYVIYDAKWFVFEDNRVSWYSIYILAHEIGHHIYGHTHGFKPDQHQGELDADRFGGWVVARLGGRLDQALAFMPYLSEKGGKTHPPRNKRIEATRKGWLAGAPSDYRLGFPR